ncbi:hypothetical protein BH10PSE6_BH10PSE6_01190 [soil metagenome]
MEIDLKLLQFAVVLARHRHFGRAAAALQISQPTLNRSFAALEKELGVRIFERVRDARMPWFGCHRIRSALYERQGTDNVGRGGNHVEQAA